MSYTGTTRTYTLWDDWNPQSEYTGGNHTTGPPTTITRRHTWLWGLDLTETLGGAGGVGGLLADQIHTGTHTGVYYPLYDGNGNIAHYLSSTGALAAHFEYDPFGKLAVAPYESATGLAAELRFRFSTKYDEPVTGLYYYGYRYYDPVTGRWPSRDPIGEQGGFNLYAFVGNDAMNWLDILGLHEVGSPFKNLNDAIIAGGEYAVILSENDLDQRIKEWGEKVKKAAETLSKLDDNDAGFEPNTYREYGGKICCIGSGENKGKFYYQKELKGELASPGRDNGSVRLSLAPPCNEGDKPVGLYHNHPPNNPKATLNDVDKKGSRDGHTPYGTRVVPGGLEGMPKNSPIGATQRNKDNKFSTQIYDPSAPLDEQIQNFNH